jgi:hypothetical protein
MKKIFLAITAIGLFFNVQAQRGEALSEKQVSKLDVSGKWVGKRHQYTADQKGVLQTFEYEFTLKQEGNLVTGLSSIFGSNGDYGDIKLRGVITGNKLIFEEYEVVNQHQTNPDRTWCFKAGELTFAKSGESVKLTGATSSFIPYYNIPCTGGFTEIVKADEGGNAIDLGKNFGTTLLDENFNVNVFPNPFFDKATISFNLDKDAKVQVQVMDLQGKVVADLQNGKLNAGNHNLVFDAAKFPVAAGNLMVAMKVNGETHSRLLAKLNY